MRRLALGLMLSTALAPLAIALHAKPMAMPIDVSNVTPGPPKTVTELDLGKLKGDLRQIGWSNDASQLYVQTADGDPQSPKLRHYVVPANGGVPQAVDAEPDWAIVY